MDIAMLDATRVIREPTAPPFVLGDGDREAIGRLFVRDLIPLLEPPLKGVRERRRMGGPQTPAAHEGCKG